MYTLYWCCPTNQRGDGEKVKQREEPLPKPYRWTGNKAQG